MAYDYGTAINRPASEVLKLSLDEIYGYYAYQQVKRELKENG